MQISLNLLQQATALDDHLWTTTCLFMATFASVICVSCLFCDPSDHAVSPSVYSTISSYFFQLIWLVHRTSLIHSVEEIPLFSMVETLTENIKKIN